MMDTDAIYSAVCAYGAARCGGYTFDAHDYIEAVKRLLNEADVERQELLATNERLVDEVAELKAAYESQFKELHELKAKLTEKASLLRGCYASDHKQKQRIEELTAERDALKAELESIKALPPVAVRYDFDGFGWQYIDNGSGSDWLTRHKDGEALYALGSKTHE